MQNSPIDSYPDRKSIALIGMPGSGKSTVGQFLAVAHGIPFIDTDILVTRASGCSLQAIVDNDGLGGLLAIEECMLKGLNANLAVIATGGSAAYSKEGMLHLRSLAHIVYLECDAATLVQRLGSYADRGIVKQPEQTIADLLMERVLLYAKYADFRVDTRGKTPDDVGKEICVLLRA